MGKLQSKITTRRWRHEDIPEIIECSRATYHDYSEEFIYSERHYEMQFAAFPQGQFVAVCNKKIVGYATSIIVSIDDDFWYDVDELTGAGTFSTHNPDGDTLYGADIAVHPDYQRRGIAMLLYSRRKSILKRYNLKQMIAYGRLSGYRNYAGKMTAEQYVEKVKKGELKDQALSTHLKVGYQVKKVQLDITIDHSSLNYSTFLVMPNPDYNLAKKRISSAVFPKIQARRVRVCAAQYHMRPIRSFEDLERSVEFFVDTADSYHCHFLLFPEYFTYQLLSFQEKKMSMRDAALKLAGYTDQYIDMFKRFARKYNIYIIGGSTPVLREGKFYNTAHLFTPAGNVHTQDKLHITPAERNEGGIEPGTSVRIFNTPLARIAIQVCYDIEFPEVSRLLTLAGAEIIFVPYYTEEKKAYYRVRHCAQARAVENFIYVVMTGSVGNMQTRSGSFLNYSQAAILTPSDFSFPEKGIEGEADPNVEAVVISELALSSLSQQRHVATVRPLHDMRLDLYDLMSKDKIKILRVE
ncbi:bifunctional GNAT family N-acetyltransferase/carbon-nitrogen hydrolase family protein [Desulfobacula toluolica]|uniref:Predicted nitrilase/cyanide hydratase and apolipoprotein N-acyltransferase n=1 Tax=Desulfobacula toluolica (strain DSM 7467 / Tol2) TaxID=651182 RepID=K0NLZ2_DESTT|nr:bifunctional GNAT family N-acetyltransferase/carbon-nitrogen hydrolase family protein [Desulfobacula toluolica]CCK79702.1 predicted nitrilase/cyanide hydratase and apolipoprotein N-acyltransferase [Desulfobacula toluolica Tol2]